MNKKFNYFLLAKIIKHAFLYTINLKICSNGDSNNKVIVLSPVKQYPGYLLNIKKL